MLDSLVSHEYLPIDEFLISFILVSFKFYNHNNKEIKYDDIEIYLLEDISSFHAYILNKDLFMIVEFKKKHTKEYLFNYCEYYTKYNLKENNNMKDSVKETLERLGISLTKETDKGTCVKTSYEFLEELAEKWETQLLKD